MESQGKGIGENLIWIQRAEEKPDTLILVAWFGLALFYKLSWKSWQLWKQAVLGLVAVAGAFQDRFLDRDPVVWRFTVYRAYLHTSYVE